MTPTPLDKIGLRWHDHKSALWWLGLLYRRPAQFENTLESFSKSKSLQIAFFLYLHSLIYIILVIVVGQYIIFVLLKISMKDSLTISLETLNSPAMKLTFGIVSAIAGGIIVGITVIIIGAILAYIVALIFEAEHPLEPFASMAILMAFFIMLTTIINLFGFPLKFNDAISLGSSLLLFFGTIRMCKYFIERSFDSVICVLIVGGIVGGIVIGSVGGIINGIIGVIISGLVIGIASGIISEFTYSDRIASGVIGLIFSMIIGGIFGGINGGIVSGIFGGIVSGIICIIIGHLRLQYFLIFPFFLMSKIPGQWYPYHPVAWDDLCRVPFPRLDRLLVAYAEYAPETGKREIERLIQSYPSQRHAALRAQTILLVRQAAQEKDLTKLEALLGPLPEGRKGFLIQTLRLRAMVGEIAGIQMRLNTVNRPVLRETIAQMLHERIENFRHQIGGFHEPLASEFRQAATHWLEIAQKQVQEAQAILTKEPSPVVFRAGDPVNREQEAFVPRYGVVGDLDKQIMLSTGCPGLVLYGRRRMGKSTVLHNLNGFLPATVIPVVISMQDPQAFTSLTDLLNLISQKLAPTVGGEIDNTVANVNLNRFMQMLAQSNEKLKATGKRVLLAIDEYENIDRKLGEKIFPEDLLVTVRESIQTHRQITWIFAGSHDITELKHAEWPSYLVSARTIEVPLFTVEETRLLLTEPMKFSLLWPKDDPKRPRFAPEFWGEDGIERIHQEAGGWPHLVQLIAETIVDLINDETKRQVDAELFERALNKAIISGHNVLYQLLKGESNLPGEWEYLAAFRKRETQPPPDNEAIYTSLRRRLLVEEQNGEWRLRVPLMARWLKERG